MCVCEWVRVCVRERERVQGWVGGTGIYFSSEFAHFVIPASEILGTCIFMPAAGLEL